MGNELPLTIVILSGMGASDSYCADIVRLLCCTHCVVRVLRGKTSTRHVTAPGGAPGSLCGAFLILMKQSLCFGGWQTAQI